MKRRSKHRSTKHSDNEVSAILAASDAYTAMLYPTESNHLLDVAALCEPQVCFLVARVDGVAAATGAVVTYQDYGELKRMFVLPAFRGKGLGQRMLNALLGQLRMQGITVARLETGIANHEACRLYERAGFQPIGPFGSYRPDPLSLFYELRLT